MLTILNLRSKPHATPHVRRLCAWTLALVLCGCSTHHGIQLDPPDAATIAELSVALQNRGVTLNLDSEQVRGAEDVRLGVDSLRWSSQDGRTLAVAPSRVRSVMLRNRGRGLLEGVLIGVGTAVAAGLVTSACCEGGPDVWFPNSWAVGVVVGSAGVPLGALIGVLAGHRVIYEAR